MPDEITCPNCQARLRVPEGAAEAWFRCPRCQARIASADVPASEPAVVPASAGDGASLTTSVPRELPRPAEEGHITDWPVPEREKFILPETGEATRRAYSVGFWGVVAMVLIQAVTVGAFGGMHNPQERAGLSCALAVPAASLVLAGIWTAKLVATRRELRGRLSTFVMFVGLAVVSLIALGVLFGTVCVGATALRL